MKKTSKKQKEDRVRGRGAQMQAPNKYHEYNYVKEHAEGIDEIRTPQPTTQFFSDHPKKIVNKVTSPDVGMMFSVNPYQGCEHGCIYCYARNSHEYWGFNAGLDFESKIVVKENAPELLRQHFENKNWKPAPISLSGNTDCYQPVERKKEITRELLKVCLEYRNPVGIITKNSLVLRDLDILEALSKYNLIHVMVSITTLDRELRRKMEPRTASAKLRLKVIRQLSQAGVPVGVMNAPIIPGLNSEEIPRVIKAAGENGACNAGYTIVRLNGAIGPIFEDWLTKTYSEQKARKVLNQIKACHGGQLNDSRWKTRIKGEGQIAQSIRQLHQMATKKYLPGKKFSLSCAHFRRKSGTQKSLF